MNSRFYKLLYILLLITLTSCTYQEENIIRPFTVKRYSTPLSPHPPLAPVAKTTIPVKPQKKGLIVLDPGHGGKDFGAHSQKYQEKLLTLSTTRLIKNYLEQFGYTVLTTRNEDIFIPLDERTNFANKNQSKIFVSIHYNTAPNSEAEGIEIFYYNSGTDKNRTNLSKSLANDIIKRTIESTEAKSRGVKHGNLAVIRTTSMPAVLIEGGFLTNAQEIQKIKDGAYMKKLAWGITLGINDYLDKNP